MLQKLTSAGCSGTTGSRYVVVDPCGEYRPHGCRIFYAEEWKQALQLMLENHKSGPLKVVLRFKPPSWKWAWGLENYTLLLEEAHAYLPSKGVEDPDLRKVLLVGRHQAINVILVSQQPQDLNPFARSQCELFVVVLV